MKDEELLLLVAGAIATSYREEAKLGGTWKNAPLNDPADVVLAKVKQGDVGCHAQIMREASYILSTLDRAGVLKKEVT
jgi:hypothetical protein